MGAGRFGTAMLPRMDIATGCSVAAVASRSRDKAARVIADAGLPNATPCTYEELPDRDDVDAVYLATPNHMHAPWSVRLLEAGKHVLVEKPLSVTRADAELAFMTAERSGRVLAEGFMYAHHPQTHALTQIVRSALTESGDPMIGRLQSISAHRNFPIRPESYDTRLSHAMHGGSLTDLGCYTLSFPVITAGRPLVDLEVTSATLAEPLPGETLGVDAGAAWAARLAGTDVAVRGSCSIMEQGSQAVEIAGDRAAISTTWAWSPDEGNGELTIRPADGGPESSIPAGEQTDRVIAQFAAFAAACRGETSGVPSASVSIHVAALLETAITLAHRVA